MQIKLSFVLPHSTYQIASHADIQSTFGIIGQNINTPSFHTIQKFSRDI